MEEENGIVSNDEVPGRLEISGFARTPETRNRLSKLTEKIDPSSSRSRFNINLPSF